MKISIVVPSLGKKDELTRLFYSLRSQTIASPVEVVIGLTGDPELLENSLPKLPSQFSTLWILSPVRGISQARNRALAHATGDVILFMDEDCSLKNSEDLKTVLNLSINNPEVVFSGRYLNSPSTLLASQFYNYMCNMWLYRHLHRITLGGCFFYYAPTFSKIALRFPEDLPVSGEEYHFCVSILNQGKSIQQIDWGVVHDPQYGWWDILKKSWSQGKTLSASPSRSASPLFWKKVVSEPAFVAPLALYYTITRLSFFWETFVRSLEGLKFKASSWIATHRSR
ncbi:MAG: glycosyltransferase family 2 protein [Bdellovibrionales bacterium]|nr:glycosyltransferase family 2 protein [Bdellovibrionales bacterium]